MSLQITIIIAIIIQIVIERVNRVAGAITGFLVTTGICVYGLYLYKHTIYVISWKGHNLEETYFVTFIVFWYIFDLFILFRAIVSQNKEIAAPVKDKETFRSTTVEDKENAGIVEDKDEASIVKFKGSGISLNSFLSVPKGRLHWQRAIVLIVAYIIAGLAAQTTISLYIGRGIPKFSPWAIWNGSLFFISIFTIFLLFSKKNLSIRILCTVLFYTIMLVGTSVIQAHFLLNFITYNLLPNLALLIVFLILSNFLLKRLSQLWAITFIAIFCAVVVQRIATFVAFGIMVWDFEGIGLILLISAVFSLVFFLPLFLVPPRSENHG